MGYSFTIENIENITKVLGNQPQEFDRGWSWTLNNPAARQALMFSIYNEAKLGSDVVGSLITVQTQHGYYELHDCNGHLVFEPDEIIFFNADENKVSCLIIGSECTCSMFTNISRNIINSDFSTLDPAVLLSAMQLSLTENVLP